MRRTTTARPGGRWPIAAPPNVTGMAVVEQPELQIVVSTSTEGVLAAGLDGSWRSANGFVNGALPTVNVRSLHYEPNSGDQYVSPTGQSLPGRGLRRHRRRRLQVR